MNSIKIKHEHSCEHRDLACEKAEAMLEDIANDYGLEISHDGEGNFQFRGSGIKGSVIIDHEHINLDASLGFLMSAMKSVIENGIKKKLNKSF
jgi:putative polyhydroxyalkanoate system protein